MVITHKCTLSVPWIVTTTHSPPSKQRASLHSPTDMHKPPPPSPPRSIAPLGHLELLPLSYSPGVSGSRHSTSHYHTQPNRWETSTHTSGSFSPPASSRGVLEAIMLQPPPHLTTPLGDSPTYLSFFNLDFIHRLNVLGTPSSQIVSIAVQEVESESTRDKPPPHLTTPLGHFHASLHLQLFFATLATGSIINLIVLNCQQAIKPERG
ncbi:hypothetical protein QBC35DRAFT_228227 [Podospora australis]|uniref:Uncharacterized protein n=1 Tax=Podospora australis TaxID=1536484 RepID=A0AAN7AMW3_9PEZI|nr:hypothetical protein QBC35DRAFT_228227 [Podospora australis]